MANKIQKTKKIQEQQLPVNKMKIRLRNDTVWFKFIVLNILKYQFLEIVKILIID